MNIDLKQIDRDSLKVGDVLEASKHMKAIMEIMEKYKEQQCLKNYTNS